MKKSLRKIWNNSFSKDIFPNFECNHFYNENFFIIITLFENKKFKAIIDKNIWNNLKKWNDPNWDDIELELEKYE